jgi:hypothetical protein
MHPPGFHVSETFLDGGDKIALLLGFQHEPPQIFIHLQPMCPGISEHSVLGLRGDFQGHRDPSCLLAYRHPYGNDWRTGEYWTPHNAFYLWALSQLESA